MVAAFCGVSRKGQVDGRFVLLKRGRPFACQHGLGIEIKAGDGNDEGQTQNEEHPNFSGHRSISSKSDLQFSERKAKKNQLLAGFTPEHAAGSKKVDVRHTSVCRWPR